jgi:hypothetical protein
VLAFFFLAKVVYSDPSFDFVRIGSGSARASSDDLVHAVLNHLKIALAILSFLCCALAA